MMLMVSVVAVVEGFILAIIFMVILASLGGGFSSGIARYPVWFSNSCLHIIW